jgi:hypothetical protein
MILTSQIETNQDLESVPERYFPVIEGFDEVRNHIR